jgi:hypothetical protein
MVLINAYYAMIKKSLALQDHYIHIEEESILWMVKKCTKDTTNNTMISMLMCLKKKDRIRNLWKSEYKKHCLLNEV